MFDSRVLLGGVVRRRPREIVLNSMHRRAIPGIVGGGLWPGPFHARNEYNAGDAGSRRRSIKLRQELAHLWVVFCTIGRYAYIDVELALEKLQ